MALPWKGGICMEIVQRRELWIHTHFVTDCVRLSQAQGRDIEAALLPVLRQQHIVYGIHFGALETIYPLPCQRSMPSPRDCAIFFNAGRGLASPASPCAHIARSPAYVYTDMGGTLCRLDSSPAY